MRATVESLGVGRIGWRSSLLLAFFAGLAGLGACAWVFGRAPGTVATGLYAVAVVELAGIGFAAIGIVVVARILEWRQLKPLSRMAEVLAIVALGLAVLAGLADPGDSLAGLTRAVSRDATPALPGILTLLVSGAFFASLAYVYLAGRADAALCAAKGGAFRWFYRFWASGFQGTPAEHNRHHRTSWWLAVGLLPLLVGAHSAIGFLLAMRGGRSEWYGSLQAPAFVLLAGVSGVGVLILLAILLYWALGLRDQLETQAFATLGNVLSILVVLHLYLVVVEEATEICAWNLGPASSDVASELPGRPLAPLFWVVVGSMAFAFLALFLQFARGRASLALTVLAAAAASGGAILKPVLVLDPDWTLGILRSPGVQGWGDLGAVVGLLALGAFLFTLFLKVFPIVPVAADPAPAIAFVGRDGRLRRAIRTGLAATSFLGGVVLTLIGFREAAPGDAPSDLLPAILSSPVVFVLGAMMICYSPAVFETIPPAPRARPARLPS